jgi:hypothetical protein
VDDQSRRNAGSEALLERRTGSLCDFAIAERSAVARSRRQVEGVDANRFRLEGTGLTGSIVIGCATAGPGDSSIHEETSVSMYSFGLER